MLLTPLQIAEAHSIFTNIKKRGILLKDMKGVCFIIFPKLIKNMK